MWRRTSEQLIDNEAPWGQVFGEYYVAFCTAGKRAMLSAFIVFLTILLFTSQLAQPR